MNDLPLGYEDQHPPDKSETDRYTAVAVLSKNIFHPQVPLRMPCYDFALVTELTLSPR